MPPSYPYAKLDEDGFELELVEFDEWENQGFIRKPVPCDDDRYGIKIGMLVKLIFTYRDGHVLNGQTYSAEHMWVKYVGDTDGCMSGELDSIPNYTKLLEAGDLVAFHPKHIVDIWQDDPTPVKTGG
jgi:hypothetical protein